MKWRAGRHAWEFPRPALVMGIVNVTPDSFSDGGLYYSPQAAVAHARELVAEGADILDIGGESTRPGAAPVPEAEESRRVMPVIEALSSTLAVPLSIDTQKPGIARESLRAGASIVNDIAANRSDPTMWEVVAGAGAGYVCMHMQGTPQTMQAHPEYQEVVAEVGDYFDERLARLAAAGLTPEQVVLDPGFGFGKSVSHNLRLLARLESFRRHRRPLLVGVSRKSFLGNILEADVSHRLAGSLACAAWAVERGAAIIRTHDVAATRQAVRMIEALMAQPTG